MRARRRVRNRLSHQEHESLSYLGLKVRGAGFCEFLKSKRLKPGILKISGLSSRRAWRVIGSGVPYLKETALKTAHRDTGQKQQFEKLLEYIDGRVIYSSQREITPVSKELAGDISLPCSS